MKHLYLLLTILLISLSAHSQNCTAPVSGMVFKQKYSQLSAMRQDQQRLSVATEFARKNCLLTYQVKQVAELFNDDITRLGFIQDAYPAIFDKENMYDLYDAFAYFSTAMRLHDFIDGMSPRDNRRNDYSGNRERPFEFPDYNYPSYENYRETTICSQPISDEVFYRVLRNVMNQRDDDSRITAAMQLAQSNCLTVAQLMKMGSLIEKEAKRLDYFKRSYDYTYDIGNYHYGNQLFKDKTYHADFDKFVTTRRGQPRKNDQTRRPDDRQCRVSDVEFQEIMTTIKGQTFENTQLSMAKQIVRTKQCFTTMQIKMLLGVFSFENTKLDMAKYCYAYCVDRGDYYKINSAFTVSTSVDELNKYISEQR